MGVGGEGGGRTTIYFFFRVEEVSNIKNPYVNNTRIVFFLVNNSETNLNLSLLPRTVMLQFAQRSRLHGNVILPQLAPILVCVKL